MTVRFATMMILVGTLILGDRGSLARPSGARFAPGTLRGLVRVALPAALPAGPCEVCPDRYCSFVRLPQAGKTLRRRLRRGLRAGRYALQLSRRLDGDRMIVSGSSGPVRCHLTRVGHRSSLFIGTPDRKTILPVLRRFILRAPPLVDRKHLGSHLLELEKLVASDRKGDRKNALNKLRSLKSDIGLADYSRVRRADVALLSGLLPTAYARYRLQSYGTSGWSPAGLVAALRASALAYIVDGRSPSVNLYESIARKTGPSAVFSRQLLGKILAHEGRLEAAFLLLRKDSANASSRAEVLSLTEALMRRCVLQGTPRCAALTLYRSEGLLQKAKRAGNILLGGARAFIALGLPREAARLLQDLLQRKPSPWLQERALSLLVRAYAESGLRFRALRSSAYYLSVYKSAPGSRAVRSMRAQILLNSGKLPRDALSSLTPSVAREARRAIAVAQGATAKISGPIWKRLKGLRRAQDRLLALIEQIEGRKTGTELPPRRSR